MSRSLNKNPVLISSAGYKRALVRHCTEQLREIEGRMEQASGPRWEQQLQSCEDLGSVAKLMIALQRRADLKDVDNGWLEELAQLSASDIDDRAIELTRLVKLRLNALCHAVPYPVDPSQQLGKAVLRPLSRILPAS